MGLANRITFFRIVLAPVFAGLFSAWSAWRGASWLILVWSVFLISEVSDILDGWVARKLHETSDLGKVLDPFSDVISRLTIFLCLLLAGVAPLWFFLIVLYREVSMTFLRLLIVQKGVVQAASTGGKLKAWLYFLASLAGLLQLSWPTLLPSDVQFWLLNGLFGLAALLSAVSFIQYFMGYRRLSRTAP
jgi:CDP-diacylglycerol---glycerol-3-phosphate 3-phosphatidyltransferase